MFKGTVCLCCLVRPPDKGIKATYSRLGKSEVFTDMLRDCFEIHVLDDFKDEGICEICIMRLRDASEFKEQVQRCQAEMQVKLLDVKEETPSKVKVKDEIMDLDNDNGIYFLEIKDEASDMLSDYEHNMDERHEDDKTIAEVLGFKNVTRTKSIKKRRMNKTDLSSAKAMNMSLRTLKHNMDKLLNPLTRSLPSSHVTDMIKHKTNIENLVKHSNCTPFLNKNISGILCAYCKKTCSNLPTLTEHIKKNHKQDPLIQTKRADKNNVAVKIDITDLKCNICHEKCERIAILKTHLTKEHGIKFYADVKDYILEFKITESENMNCALCNSTFETFKMLLQHMNGHYRNYVCDVCDLGFLNKHKLRNHHRIHELGQFNCDFCKKIFNTRMSKLCHEKYVHRTNARYTTNCPHCEETFTSYYQRNRHMATAHNSAAANYKCNICERSFILKSKLTYHIKQVHLMEKNHICPECGHGFFVKRTLDEHMIKHSGERIYKCVVCNKAYARKKTLREHMRIHNNDRRFKCGMCMMAFVQKCSLKSHMLSNHGVTLAEYENNRVGAVSP